MVKKAPKKKAGKKATGARKSTPPASRSSVKRRAVARTSGDLPHRLDTLLHTMRCIAQHEDELCGLLHDARRSGRISAALLQELQTILQDLPAEDYLHDLHALQQVISAA